MMPNADIGKEKKSLTIMANSSIIAKGITTLFMTFFLICCGKIRTDTDI